MTALPDLATFIHETLGSRYGSIAHASDKLGLSYERLKKALQRNRFSAADLEVLLPDQSVEQLKAAYAFDMPRRYGGGSGGRPDDDHLFNKIYTPFISLQKAARETEFKPFVDNLYQKLTDGLSMVLFCHRASEPVEWEADDREVHNELYKAIKKGGVIVYVMESDLQNLVIANPTAPDGVDKKFNLFLNKIKQIDRQSSASEASEEVKGFVALLRVPRCSFCIPHQKSALFSKIDENEVYRQTVTTVAIPETMEGYGNVGTVVLPQIDDVARHMVEYINELLDYVRNTKEELEPNFRFKSFPELNRDKLMDRIEAIA